MINYLTFFVKQIINKGYKRNQILLNLSIYPLIKKFDEESIKIR